MIHAFPEPQNELLVQEEGLLFLIYELIYF